MKTKTNYKLLFTLAFLSWGATATAQTDITNTGGTVSAQYSDSPANETIAQLIDNASATKYLTFHNAGWVQYTVSQPYVVTKYAITSANDAPARDPMNWTFQGSNNGTSWTTINTQSGQTFATRFLRREFSFTNTIAYTQYRLNFTSSSGTILQLAELEIYGVLNITDITNLAGAITAQYSDSPAGETIDKVIDNQSATKYLTLHNAAWIKFQQGNPSVVSGYSITSANDEDTRDPFSWTFQGSNDDAAWTTLDTRSNEDFLTRFQRREFSITNTMSFTYYRLNITNNSGTILQLAEWEILGTGGGGVISIPNPPATWQEHWFEHNQLLSLVFYDNDVAVYYDNDVDRSVTWTYQFIGDVWRYTKNLYGSFGKDPRLYAVLHTGKYPGGHPSGYFDSSHDFRNVLDVGPGPWTSNDYNAVAIPTHEVAHIVEGSSKDSHGSPAFSLWGDSKWAEIYNYDVYRGLGKTDYATQWYNEQIGRSDAFPRANTFWFRDWFYPIYNQYGQAQVLNRYFTLLSQCFTKNGVDYARDLNWGEFVHFWSGAAGVNLKSLATNAFGWPAEWETQFRKAQQDFPCVTYTNASARFTINETQSLVNNKTDGAVSVWYNSNAKEVNIVDETSKLLIGEAAVYTLFGNNVMKSQIKSASNVAALDASHLAHGVYIVIVNSNGKMHRKRILVQ